MQICIVLDRIVRYQLIFFIGDIDRLTGNLVCHGISRLLLELCSYCDRLGFIDWRSIVFVAGNDLVSVSIQLVYSYSLGFPALVRPGGEGQGQAVHGTDIVIGEAEAIVDRFLDVGNRAGSRNRIGSLGNRDFTGIEAAFHKVAAGQLLLDLVGRVGLILLKDQVLVRTEAREDGPAGIVSVAFMIDLLLQGLELGEDGIAVGIVQGSVRPLVGQGPHVHHELFHIRKGGRGDVHPLLGIGNILLVILVDLVQGSLQAKPPDSDHRVLGGPVDLLLGRHLGITLVHRHLCRIDIGVGVVHDDMIGNSQCHMALPPFIKLRC